MAVRKTIQIGDPRLKAENLIVKGCRIQKKAFFA